MAVTVGMLKQALKKIEDDYPFFLRVDREGEDPVEYELRGGELVALTGKFYLIVKL